jgi:hypothetical protein
VCGNAVACAVRALPADGDGDRLPLTDLAIGKALAIAATMRNGRVVPDPNGGVCIYVNESDHVHVWRDGTAETISFVGGKVKREVML